MGTRCTVTCRSDREEYTIYRQFDGYPSRIIPDLVKALPFAWELPRFESSDFAAAIVRAWKEEGGGHIRIVKDRETIWSTDYHYKVTQQPNGIVTVTVYERDWRDPDGFDAERWKTVREPLHLGPDMVWVEDVSD